MSPAWQTEENLGLGGQTDMADQPVSIEKVKIVEVARVGGVVLVTFSDGRVTTLGRDDSGISSNQHTSNSSQQRNRLWLLRGQ